MAYRDLEEFFQGEDQLLIEYKEEVLKDADAFANPWYMGEGKVMVVVLPFAYLLVLSFWEPSGRKDLGQILQEQLEMHE